MDAPSACLRQRWMEESLVKKADQSALRLWHINETLFSAYPHYLAASGAPVQGSLPGISMHTELELLVRLGHSQREALAAATNNYSLQFGWNELGLIAPAAAPTSSSSTPTPQRASGTSAASPASSSTAM